MRAIRRQLREEQAVPRERLEVIGHWRERLTSDEANVARNEALKAARAAGAGEDELDDLGL